MPPSHPLPHEQQLPALQCSGSEPISITCLQLLMMPNEELVRGLHTGATSHPMACICRFSHGAHVHGKHRHCRQEPDQLAAPGAAIVQEHRTTLNRTMQQSQSGKDQSLNKTTQACLHCRFKLQAPASCASPCGSLQNRH